MKRGTTGVSSAWKRGGPLDDFETALASRLPRLRRFAHGLARDRMDADDLTQRTAERALKARSQWQPGTSFDAWAYRIMRNLWIDTIRSRRRRGSLFAPSEEGADVGAEGGAETQAELRFLMRAMDRLPEEQREAVALVMIEGLSYAQAADVLEIPAGTLTSRLVRGRQALVQMLRGGD
ncbi:MAG TPA: RNA polymerase sigma factor [Sphingomonas sp.]|nr:RNA polymerase sigma factor [Sphingomonas sp.]